MGITKDTRLFLSQSVYVHSHSNAKLFENINLGVDSESRFRYKAVYAQVTNRPSKMELLGHIPSEIDSADFPAIWSSMQGVVPKHLEKLVETYGDVHFTSMVQFGNSAVKGALIRRLRETSNENYIHFMIQYPYLCDWHDSKDSHFVMSVKEFSDLYKAAIARLGRGD